MTSIQIQNKHKDILLAALLQDFCNTHGYTNNFDMIPKISDNEVAKYISLLHSYCRKDNVSVPITNRMKEFDIIKSEDTGIGNTIYYVKHHIDQKMYVIKQIPYHNGVERESIIHSTCDSMYTVRYHTSWYELINNELYLMIQMELCDGDLETLDVKKEELVNILEQIVSGLQELHNNNIIHRDIKPSNIFYKKNKNNIQIKIADFGSATFENNNHELVKYGSNLNLSNDVGTELYAAPEITTGNYDNKVDNYSLGLLIHELDTKPNRIQKMIEFDKIKEDNKIVKNGIVRKLLDSDPKKRMRLDTVKKRIKIDFINA